MMNISLNRHDLSYLISAILIIVATITAATGLASDVWDLNDFIFHKYGGYVLAVLALIHVCLHWGRLVAYSRWHLSGRPRVRRYSAPRARRGVKSSQKSRGTEENGAGKASDASGEGSWPRISRRDLFPLTLAGLGGFALGRVLQPEPPQPYGGNMGILYHEWSKPKLLSLFSAVTDWGQKPTQYKEYPAARRIALPPPGEFKGVATEEAIRQRRSKRNYSGQEMTFQELSRLLYYACGITEESWEHKLRSAPSAGAVYPIETYPVIHRVQELEAGLYHYGIEDHALELLQAGDLRGEIVKHGLMQEFLGRANLVLVFTAIFQRLRWKYKERSYRYALLEAGHLGQNVYLAGTSMGLGVCAVGAFFDDDLNAMLKVDGQEEAAIYMLAVGKT